MAFALYSNVRETSTTTGTGTLTLAGAVSGYAAFSARYSNGDTMFVTARMGADWETFLGTYSAGTIARTTMFKSTNGDLAVNWGAGTKDIFVTLPGVTELDATNKGRWFDAILARASDAEAIAATATDKILTPGNLAAAFPGAVIDRVYGSYATNANLTATFPLDDTIPQISEGTQIISVSITPKTTTNRLRATFRGQASNTNVSGNSVAMFLNSGANAVQADHQTCAGASFSFPFTMTYEWVPGATSSQTIAVRAGPSANTMRFNGSAAGRLFGGVAAATLVVEEIKG